ncbi:MAG: ATP-binding protein [Candidatus Sumerlaeota bacterium]|nr:ATP-binding protein [Candidatus Sumerlaeota bacterium]
MKSRFLPLLAALATFALALGVAWLLDRAEQERFQERSRAEATKQLNGVGDRLGRALSSRLFVAELLKIGVSRFSRSSSPDFQAFAQQIVSESETGVRRLELARTSKVNQVYPLEGNENREGLNLLEDPVERDAVNKAIQTKETALSGPEKTPEGAQVLSAWTPIYAAPREGEPEGDRYWGLAGIVIDMKLLYREAGLYDPESTLVFALRAEGPPSHLERQVFFGDPQVYQWKPVLTEIAVPGGKWELAAAPFDGWPTSAEAAWWHRLLGGVVSAGLAWLVFLWARAPVRLREAVERATAALRESEKRFRDVLEVSNDMIYRIDLATKTFDYVSPASQPLLGFSPEEVQALGIDGMRERIHPEDRARIVRAQEGEWRGEIEPADGPGTAYRWRRRDDVYRYYSESRALVRDDSGKPLAIVGALRDVTARRLAIEALRYRMQFEELIANISAQFINLPPRETGRGILHALEALGEFVEVDRCYVFLYSHDATRMDCTHEWCAEGIESAVGRLKDLPTEAFPWIMRRLQAPETVHIPRVADLPPEAQAEKEEFRAEGIQSLICVPMVSEGKPVGFLGFDSVRQEKEWTSDAAALLKMAGELFVNALERERADRELTRSLSLLRATLESTADGILVIDNAGRIVDYNRKYQEMWGLSQEVLATRDTPQVLAVVSRQLADPDAYVARVMDIISQTEAESHDIIKLTDGRIFERYSQPHHVGGKSVGRVYSFRDITERVRHEDTLRETNARLDTANRRLQEYSANLEQMVRERTAELELQKEKALESSRLKGEFLSLVSHELRTPLNSILGLTKIVLMRLGKDLPVQQKRNLRSIISSGERLLTLINQILDLSRIEARRMAVSLSTFSADALLSEAIEAIRPLARGKALDLRAHNKASGARVRGDHTKILQILINLLGNAVKFTEAGAIDLTARAENGGFAFSVADTGIGLTPEEQAIIFDSFRQVDASATRRYSGSGLGLTISRHLAELLGGTIAVESEKGKGATFTLWIPNALAEEEPGDGGAEGGRPPVQGS